MKFKDYLHIVSNTKFNFGKIIKLVEILTEFWKRKLILSLS